MTEHPNIAVVVLDTLRKDSFESSFDWIEGTVFRNAYSTSHWTVPAHGSLFTGRYPSEIGVHSKSQTLDCQESTIAEELFDKGYQTSKYSANLNIHAWGGWNRGFDTNIGPDDLKSYYDKDTVSFTEFKSRSDFSGIMLYLSAVLESFRSDSSTIYSLLEGVRTVTESYSQGGSQSVIRELNNRTFSNREFIFINLMDSHVPYYPPEDYRRLDRPVSANSWEPFKNGVSNLKEVTTAYEDCVGYISDKYRTIFNKLKNNFDYVITLSDHGEMLGEFGMIEHAYGLYPSLVNIPVVISGPGIANTQIDTPISILDVHATIADLAGVSTDSRGHSLLQDEIQPRDRLVEYHGFPPWIRTSFLENGISEQEYERLNRPLRGFIDRDGVYSFETHSDGLVVECQEPEDLEQREEKLEKLQSEVDQREIKQEQLGASEAVLSRLEDLGYA